MDSCFNCNFSPRKATMKGKFYIEGHRSKTGWDDEDTSLFESDTAYKTIEEATAVARDYFEKEKDLHLAVIYQKDPLGTKVGARMVFRNDEGDLEESNLFY